MGKAIYVGDMASLGKPREPLNLYSMFLSEFQTIAASTPQTESEIMKHFGIERAQARKWLKQADRDGKADKVDVEGCETVWISRPGSG